MARPARKKTARKRSTAGKKRSGQSLHRGKTAVERRAERRERLLATGLELFGTRGFGDTTIEGICAHAHVTARHFYQDFESREALLHAVYDRLVSQSMGVVAVALQAAPADEPLERARAGLGAFVDTLLEDPRRARVHCVQVVGVSAELEAHRRGVMRSFGGIIEREARALVDRGLLPDRPFQIAAMALVAAVNELVIESLESPERFPPEAIVDEAASLFIAAARVPPTAAARKAMR